MLMIIYPYCTYYHCMSESLFHYPSVRYATLSYSSLSLSDAWKPSSCQVLTILTSKGASLLSKSAPKVANFSRFWVQLKVFVLNFLWTLNLTCISVSVCSRMGANMCKLNSASTVITAPSKLHEYQLFSACLSIFEVAPCGHPVW